MAGGRAVITMQDIRDALTKCTGYDPVHFPRPSNVIAEAWFEHFAMYPRITGTDVLAAITRYYMRPSQPVPQPADIRVLASEIRRERFDRSDLGSMERQQHEAVCDAKAQPERTQIEARQRAIAEFDFRPEPMSEAKQRRRLVDRHGKAAPPLPLLGGASAGAKAEEL
jgi:hypothetical protein